VIVHRVDQVVRHVASGQRLLDLVDVENVASAYFDLPAPRSVGEFVRGTRQADDVMPGLDQPGYEPTTHVSGGSGDSNSHRASSSRPVRSDDRAASAPSIRTEG
jgi:hypothetical protein